MNTYLCQITSINAPPAAGLLQFVPHLLVDDSVPIGIAHRSVDVQLLIHVAISQTHSFQVHRKISLTVHNSGGQRWDVDSSIGLAENVDRMVAVLGEGLETFNSRKERQL